MENYGIVVYFEMKFLTRRGHFADEGSFPTIESRPQVGLQVPG